MQALGDGANAFMESVRIYRGSILTKKVQLSFYYSLSYIILSGGVAVFINNESGDSMDLIFLSKRLSDKFLSLIIKYHILINENVIVFLFVFAVKSLVTVNFYKYYVRVTGCINGSAESTIT